MGRYRGGLPLAGVSTGQWEGLTDPTPVWPSASGLGEKDLEAAIMTAASVSPHLPVRPPSSLTQVPKLEQPWGAGAPRAAAGPLAPSCP